MQAKPAMITSLPLELHHMLRKELSIPSLVQLSQTCHYFRDMYNEELFKKLCHQSGVHLFRNGLAAVTPTSGSSGRLENSKSWIYKSIPSYKTLARIVSEHGAACGKSICSFPALGSVVSTSSSQAHLSVC